MKKYRVGVIGCTGIGTRHAFGVSGLPNAELAAGCDLAPDALDKFRETYQQEWPDLALYTSYQDMLKNANLDIVSVTTHNFHHHQPVIEAAEASVKIILVEKPLAVSVELGRKMVEACETRGSRLLVDHTRRFLPHYRKLKRMVNEGAVGEIKTITYSGARPLLHNGTHTVDYDNYFTDAEPESDSGFLNKQPVSEPCAGGMDVSLDGDVVLLK